MRRRPGGNARTCIAAPSLGERGSRGPAGRTRAARWPAVGGGLRQGLALLVGSWRPFWAHSGGQATRAAGGAERPADFKGRSDSSTRFARSLDLTNASILGGVHPTRSWAVTFRGSCWRSRVLLERIAERSDQRFMGCRQSGRPFGHRLYPQGRVEAQGNRKDGVIVNVQVFTVLRHFWCKLERQFNRAVQLFNPCVMFKVAQDFETPPLPKGCCLEHAQVHSTGNHLHQK